jgi:hypothetical protein
MSTRADMGQYFPEGAIQQPTEATSSRAFLHHLKAVENY